MRNVVVLCIVMLLPGGFFCQRSNKAKLFIYNWTYYIPDEVVREFERRFNATIVYDMYASNEEMFAKLKAGGGGYDLVFPSGDYVSIMIREGMLEPIDTSKLPKKLACRLFNIASSCRPCCLGRCGCWPWCC